MGVTHYCSDSEMVFHIIRTITVKDYKLAGMIFNFRAALIHPMEFTNCIPKIVSPMSPEPIQNTRIDSYALSEKWPTPHKLLQLKEK